ncbi:unnamed protein product, partial [Laminaria digitata]
LDLGAELIHGDETSLYQIAKEKGWEMEELISLAQGDGGPIAADTNDGFGLFYLGGEKRMLAMDSKDPDFVHLNNYFDSLGDMWPDMKLESVASGKKQLVEPPPLSLRDGLIGAGVGEAMMGVAVAGYANTVGAALEETGLRGTCFLHRKWDVDGDRTFVLKDSLGKLVDELSTGFESRTQTDWPVAKINYAEEGGVTVTCRDGRLEKGTHVVSTLPLSVLRDGDVKFWPSLPKAKLTAFQLMKMCNVVKVILKFDREALPRLLHGCVCSESFIPEFWFRHLPNIPEGGYTCLAVGFVAGPPADAVSALAPEEALKKALDQLDDMFRGREWLEGGGCTGKGDWEHEKPGAKSQRATTLEGDGAVDGGGGGAMELPSASYVGGLVHDWADEPFVRGGYCYPGLGFDENTHGDAAASVDGSLFFAGEHTNTPTGMTAHAALDSGER